MNWDASVSRRLMEFVSAASGGTLAAFDADGTLWNMDAGESFLRWAGEEGRLPRWKGNAAWKEYERRLATGDLRHAFEFCVTAFEGIDAAEVGRWAAEFVVPRCDSCSFGPVRELIGALVEREVDVWVVSGSPAWCVAPGAARLGITPDRVIGGEPELDTSGRITARLRRPLPIHETKVGALVSAAGRAPHFAAGNSEYDYPLLESARVLALLVNPPDGDGWHRRKNGASWLVQRWAGAVPDALAATHAREEPE